MRGRQDTGATRQTLSRKVAIAARRRLRLGLLLCLLLWLLPGAHWLASAAAAQSADAALMTMVETERAFARRATVVGWKESFIEYFSDTAIGFDGDHTGPAKEQFRQAPDPPSDLQLLWEPRYGDIAASGDFGYLTGPSTNINPARNNGAPRHGNYASVWKREADGTFRVVMDVGVSLPAAAPFAPGFVRAPRSSRYTGTDTAEAATRALRDADAALTKAARASQADAYRGRIADGARFHRADVMPLVGETASLAWLRTQPPYSAGDTGFAEAARSGDLGYTWGTYATPAVGAGDAQKGFYVRVWARGRDGAWTVALDVLQPQ